MRSIWNPWHGCIKKSEGCDHCYMYYLDKKYDKDGADIYKVKNAFNYPIQKDRKGSYKVKSGQTISVCMTSDFFLAEADEWREDAWDIMRERQDVIFYLLTKRPERVKEHLPKDWGDGWENIFFNVTCENQKRADERIPILLDLPFKHKGIMCAPFIGEIQIDKYLKDGQIEMIMCDGENYDGARPLHYEWVKSLSDQAKKHNVTFYFCGTGNKFIKDGKEYNIEKKEQSSQSYKAGLNFKGKPQKFILKDTWGLEIPENELYKPYYHPVTCKTCPQRMLCSGCTKCGKCEK